MGKSYAIVFVLLILSGMVLGTVCFHPVKAQVQGNITINADGSTSPSTAPIQQTSNVYSLISDIVGSITVHASNIILDGSGHNVSSISLQGTLNVTIKNCVVTMKNQFAETIGMSLDNATNNLIVNNTVSGFWSIYALNGILFAGISVRGGNSNTITQNNLMYNLDGIAFANTSDNLIVQNNVTSSPVWSPYTMGISFFDASNNTVYHNNFVNNRYQAQNTNSINVWDNGNSDGGNYWNDYKTKYPSATEIGNSGLGNTPYIIDPNNTDRYPLVNQFDITAIAPTPTPTVPEFQLWAIPFLLTLMVLSTGLLVYHKKHKRKSKTV